MYRLEYRSSDGNVTAFDEQRVLRVGRGADNDIVLSSPTVSRNHAELRPTDTGWDLHDSGSSAGTWIDGQRIVHIPLGLTTIVRFGAEQDGVEATITVDLPAAAAGEAPDDQQTAVLRDQQRTHIYRSGQFPADRPTGGLLIRTRDGDKRVDADKTARIGRDIRSDVVADDPLVSRHHANVERRADGWWFADLSNSGSYIDGKPVKEKRITEQTLVQLGHPEAGYQVTLVPVVDIETAQKAMAGKRRRRRIMQVAAAAAVVAVVGGGVTAAVLLTGGDEQQDTLSTAELDRAKRASVQIVMTNSDGKWLERGSGTIVSADGLILTNQHVAGDPISPESPESEDEPRIYLVAFAKDDATPAEPKYRATTIVSDDYLDIAVMKISANADGSPLDPAKLTLPEPVPIGDSNTLRTGDRITALGYPALTSQPGASSGPLTVTSGDVASFKPDPATKTERWWIDSTERIGSGNSGGASINNAGELIGINSAVISAEKSGGSSGDFTSGSSLVRPVTLAANIIDVARNGGDPKYASPYAAKLPALDANATLKSAGWDKTKSGDCTSFNDEDDPAVLTGVHDGDAVFAEFLAAGIPEYTPIEYELLADDQETVLDSGSGSWRFDSSQQCVTMGLEVPAGIRGAYAVFSIGYHGQLVAVNPVKFN